MDTGVQNKLDQNCRECKATNCYARLPATNVDHPSLKRKYFVLTQNSTISALGCQEHKVQKRNKN